MTEPSSDSEGRVRRLDGWEVLSTAAEMAGRGEEFALATVVWRQGPSSGQQGSRAIVTADGRLLGWIGGACAEPVVIREAQRVIRDREPALLLLGTPEQFGPTCRPGVPHGMTVIPISCQSEGAVEVYVEPVVPTVHSPSSVARRWRTPWPTWPPRWTGAPWSSTPTTSPADGLDGRSVVVVATQGHGDEEAVERAVGAEPAFVGLVASQKRGEAVLGYLADRGVPRERLDRVRVPVGLDLGHTSHREIAVAILAELVQLRATGALGPAASGSGGRHGVLPLAETPTAIDPVCGMTVNADAGSHPLEHDGTTYYFCCVGCHDRFAADPARYLSTDSLGQEA